MEITKRYKKELLIFAFLVLLPFGQLFNISARIGLSQIIIRPLDLVVVSSIPFLFTKTGYKYFTKYFSAFLGVILFSFLLSIPAIGLFKSLIGGFYLIRLFGYFSFACYAIGVLKEKSTKEKVLKALVGVSLVSSFFGFLQYFFSPDFRPFLEFGWDEHLYRLVGTFFDPGFLSLIFVLGFIGSCFLYLKEKKGRWLIIMLMLIAALSLTYARSGYLAFALSGIYIFARRKVWNLGLFLATIFIVLIIFLPRPEGEGVRLERVASVFARVENYKEAVTLFGKFPVFGVGFNNLCLYKSSFTGETGLTVNSCSGFDSSLLTIATTTGIVGVISFFQMLSLLARDISQDIYGKTLIASTVALFVHSLFVNSFFYPWILGWMLILFALSVKKKTLE